MADSVLQVPECGGRKPNDIVRERMKDEAATFSFPWLHRAAN